MSNIELANDLISELSIKPFNVGAEYFVYWKRNNKMIISKGTNEEQAILHFYELYKELSELN